MFPKGELGGNISFRESAIPKPATAALRSQARRRIERAINLESAGAANNVETRPCSSVAEMG